MNTISRFSPSIRARHPKHGFDPLTAFHQSVLSEQGLLFPLHCFFALHSGVVS